MKKNEYKKYTGGLPKSVIIIYWNFKNGLVSYLACWGGRWRRTECVMLVGA